MILVLVAGAELFTGNNLIVMAWASRQVATRRLLGNWGIVWVGNFVGAFATAVLMYVSEQYTFEPAPSGKRRSRSASPRRASDLGRRSRSGCSATRLSASPCG